MGSADGTRGAEKPQLKLLLAAPRGFCAGVERAIRIVELALEKYGAPVSVRHEIVHNRFVVERLEKLGAIFIDELDEAPDEARVIFSAHGVPKSVPAEAQRRHLNYFDATCPLVSKVHVEAERHYRAGHEIVLIGHAGHPEVEGTMGQYDSPVGGAIYLVDSVEEVAELSVHNADELAYVTQTTLSVEDAAAVVAALRTRVPKITGPKRDDICYATQSRQDAVKMLAERCDLLLVVGSPNSSNSNRLREVAERQGAGAYLIDSAEDIESGWFDGVTRIGVTAGASAPEVLVQEVLARLRRIAAGAEAVEEGEGENVYFPLPTSLR